MSSVVNLPESPLGVDLRENAENGYKGPSLAGMEPRAVEAAVDFKGDEPVPFTRQTIAWSLGILAAIAITAVSPGFAAFSDDAPPTSIRSVPEGLNFANGLFRERLYAQAAKEYEAFLQTAKAGSEDAVDARFGLANARLFQGEYAKSRASFQEFLRQAPTHANASTAWYRVGETSYMLGDLTSARQAFEKYTTAYPGHKHADTAWPYLGDVCLRTGDLARARESYEKSLALHPQGRLADRARFGLGRTLALQGHPDEALALFTALVEGGGKDWVDKAWFRIGQIHVGAKNDAKAIEAFAKVEQAAATSPLIPEARLNRAEALARLGKRDEAEPLLASLIKDAPGAIAAQAAFALGTIRLEQGDATSALAVLDDASKKFAETPMASALLFRSAEAALKLEKPDDARARFLRAAEVDPKDPWADDAFARAARLALGQHDNEGAAALSQQFLAKFPNSPLRADARLVGARAALAQGTPRDAIAALTESLEKDQPTPATAEALRYYLGLAYRADGQIDKAAEVLDALAKTPAAPIAADAQFMIGQGQMEAGHYADAIPPLEKYLAGKADGDVADYALAYLVQANLELKKPDAAWKALATLAQKFPTSKTLAATRVRAGESALAAKEWDKASEQFEKAAAEATEPGLAGRARLGLGWAKLNNGKPGEAAEVFARFVTENPRDPLAAEAALAEARAYETAKDADKARDAFGRVIRNYPESEQAPLAALAKARLLAEAKRPGEAADAYKALVEKPPKELAGRLDAILADWGWALIDAGKADEADKVFARLLEQYPESEAAADARVNLAESANQAGKHDEVVKLLSPMAAPGAKAPARLVQSALYRLGRTQAETKDWTGAAKTLDRLTNDFPENPYRREVSLLRAEAALEAGDAEKANTLLEVIEKAPSDPNDPQGFSAAARRTRLQALLALKKWNEVVEAAEKLKKDSPDDPRISEVEYARGRALQQLARWDEARASYEAVIAARKGGDLVARAQLMIGETYFHQKEYHEAVRHFLKVDILYDARPWQAVALLEAGKAYEQLAQWDDAAKTYERLLSRFPGEPSANDAKSRLESVKARSAGT